MCRTDTPALNPPKKAPLCSSCGEPKKDHICEWSKLDWAAMEGDTSDAWQFMHQRRKDRQNGGFPQPLCTHPDAQRWLKPSGVPALETLSRQNWTDKVASARAFRKELHLKQDKSAEDLAALRKLNEILAPQDAGAEKMASARRDRRELRSKENKTAEDLEVLRKFNEMLASQDGHYRRLAEIRAKMDGAEELENWEVSLLEADRIYEEQLRAHKLWFAQEFAAQHRHARPRYDTYCVKPQCVTD